MACRLGNCWLPVFVGSAGRQLDSAPPLPPPSSHSAKAGISLSLHPLRSSPLYKASDNRQHQALLFMVKPHSKVQMRATRVFECILCVCVCI